MTAAEAPFTIIGENIHATRSLSRTGRAIVAVDGLDRVAFVDTAGQARTMPLAQPIASSAEYAKGRVKHIRNALLLGLGGDSAAPVEMTGHVDPEAARAGRDYLVAAAGRQIAAGAHYLDINVDEIANDPAIRMSIMEWLVRLLEPESTVPLALDSSSSSTLEAGCRASVGPSSAILLNSASADRLEVLDLAAERGAPVVLSAGGTGMLPTDVNGRVANAVAIISTAIAKGVALERLHVDVLVVPVGVDATAGEAYLEAARRIRSEFGDALRVTGGLSNVSFGLPNRQLLNDVFVALAMDAGVDSGIVDPIAVNVDRVRAIGRDAPSFAFAANVITGIDAYAIDYLAAYRAGLLGAAAPTGAAS